MDLLDISEEHEVSQELADEYPQSKQRKLRILNYLRDNYLRIILALTGLTIILILLLILSIVLNVKNEYSKPINMTTLTSVIGVSAENTGRRANNKDSTITTMAVTGAFPTLKNNQIKSIARKGKQLNMQNKIIASINGNIVGNGTVISRRRNFEVKQEVTTLQPKQDEMKIPCHKIKCEHFTQPCNISTLEYANIKRYSCCGCLGDELRLVRYEKSEITKSIAIVIAGAKTDPCEMSIYDLQLRSKLPCITGNWDIQRESDALCYLRFNLIGTCPYISDE